MRASGDAQDLCLSVKRVERVKQRISKFMQMQRGDWEDERGNGQAGAARAVLAPVQPCPCEPKARGETRVEGSQRWEERVEAGEGGRGKEEGGGRGQAEKANVIGSAWGIGA